MTDVHDILLVEDSQTQAKEYKLRLEREGFNVTIAEDGITALSMAENIQPALIVLDVNLPGMNGFQVCKRLKRDDNLKAIPVVMLTTEDTVTDTITGLESGADDYIPKDVFAIENLLSTIRSLLELPDPRGGI